MFHKIRWTVQKITQRLGLIEPLVYRKSQPLAAFRYLALGSPTQPPPVDPEVDDSGWPVIELPLYPKPAPTVRLPPAGLPRLAECDPGASG